MHGPGGDLGGLGDDPPKFEVGGRPRYPSPQYLGNSLCTRTKTRYATYIMGFCNAFQAEYVPYDEMTKKGSSEFLGGKMEFFSKKGCWENSARKISA